MRAVLFACIILLALCPFAASANTPDALKAIEQNARNSHSDAIFIEREGSILLQVTPASGEDSIHLMSATKSVVALAIGLLLDDGKLASIDEPVSTVYPEWRQGRKRNITIRMLMDHTSGLQNVANAGAELEGAADLVKLALAAEVTTDPGTAFAYNNKATNLLPGIVERLAGKPLDVYLDERLFKPLGITRYAWMKDEAGTPLGMAGLSLSAVDLAAIGRLMLDGGVTPGGKRLLSKRSVALMTAESARSPEVGLLWWRIPAWEQYRLKSDAAALLTGRSMDATMRSLLLATKDQTFESKTALIAFLAERLGPGWPQRYASEITGRGLKLSDIFDIDRGPVVAYAANGYLGQHLVIVPEKGLVAVRQIHRRESHSAPLDDYATFPLDVLRLAKTL